MYIIQMYALKDFAVSVNTKTNKWLAKMGCVVWTLYEWSIYQ